jgi:LysM repeat protein
MTTPAPAAVRTAPTDTGSSPIWTVTKGDTLWGIAEQALGDPLRYPQIADLNEGRIQPDGRVLRSDDFLLPGWQLRLPADAHLPESRAAQPADHPGPLEAVVVEPGDTLSQISLDTLGDANEYAALARANGIADPDLIYPGQIIRIPAPIGAASDSDGSESAEGIDTVDSPPAETAPAAPADEDQHGDVRPAADEADDTATAGVADVRGGLTDRSHEGESLPGEQTAHTVIPPTPPANSTAPDIASGPAGASDTKPAQAAGTTVDDGTSIDQRGLLLAGITTLTAALAWAGLFAARRRLKRIRTRGQQLRRPLELEAAVEKTLRQQSDDDRLARIDRALRSVAPVLAQTGTPPIRSILIGPDLIELHPAESTLPPAPLSGTDTAWQLPLSVLHDLPDVDERLCPLPTLVTMGTTGDGRIAMANLEQIGALHLAGDRGRVEHLVNHMILEMSQTPWTDGIHLHLADRDLGLRALDSDRVRPATDLNREITALAAHARAIRELLRGRSITEARLDEVFADAWEPHILITDSPGPTDQTVDLLDSLQRGPAAATALITYGANVGAALVVDITADGATTIPSLFGDTEIQTPALTDTELSAIAALFTVDIVDQPDRDDDRHPKLDETDASGPEAENGAMAATALTDSDGAGLHIDAGLDAIAGQPVGTPMNGHATTLIRDAPTPDPDTALDADLTEWHADQPQRPKIAILGPAHVTGLGQQPDRPQSRQIEMAVYLALYEQGVTAEKLDGDLWPSERRPASGARRVALTRLRAWLGDDPRTGDAFVPVSDTGYFLTDRLLDADLFTRLTRRSERRTRAGDARDALDDLRRALDLVRGPVLPEAGGHAYAWLANGDRLEDRTLPLAIIDAAHAAVDIALAIGDVAAAESATMTARRIDPDSTVPLCDLIRIADYCGDSVTAAGWAQTVLAVNDVSTPDDLPDDFQQVVAAALPRRQRS